MKTKRIISLALFAIAAGLLVWWFACGHHPWTTTESMIEVKSTDELFGTSVTTQKWVDDFTPGILPLFQMNAFTIQGLTGFFGLGSIAFIFIAIGVWLWISAKKQAQKMIV